MTALLDPDRLIAVGQTVARTVRCSRAEIAEFARQTHDDNPLHVDIEAARRAGFTEVIASGQHTSSIMMGLLASHFSRRDDGVPRELLVLNMNFAFKAPIYADQDVVLRWRVTSVERSSRLGGLLAQLDGAAAVGNDPPAVIGRGSILVKEGVA